MNFKAGDIVWCIDPDNNDGLYTVTYYHRKCVVVSPKGMFKDYMMVRCLSREKDERENISRLVWNVEKKFFAHVQQKAVIV